MFFAFACLYVSRITRKVVDECSFLVVRCVTSSNNDQILTVILIMRRYLNFQRNFSVVGYSQLHAGAYA